MFKRALVVSVAVAAVLSGAPALAQEAAQTAAQSAALNAPPATPEVPALDYRHRTLDNGLRVYTLQDRSSPTVSVQVWYDVGSKDDPQGRSGFAHLFEHILSRMTRNIPRGYINTLVEDVGGSRNASTGPDYTNYFEVVPSHFLETMLWTHAERMDRLVVDAEIFDAERSIVQEELRQRVLATPYGRLQRFVMINNSWRVSPYHRPGIGSIEELNAATVDDALAFHDAYYRPDNAVLVVSGDFDQAQLDAWIDEHFGPIRAPDRPIPRFTAEEPVREGPRSVTAYAPNVPLPAIVWSYPAPPVNHPDTPALQVLDAILTSGDSSRFHQALVRGGVAASAGAYNYQLEDGGFYGPQIIVSGESDIESAEAALQAQIDLIRTTPVTEAELAEARTEIVAGALQSRQTAMGRGFALADAIMTANDPDFADENLERVAQVTAADVLRVAQTYLRDDQRVSIRYLDESQRPEGAADPVAPSVERYGLDLPPNQRPLVTHASDAERVPPPAPIEPRSPLPPQFSERTLSNGLRVIVARSGDQPLFTAYLSVGGGDAAESEPGSAVNEFTADMLTRGAGGLSSTEIAARIERLGGAIGAGGGSDRQTLFVTAPQVNAEQAGAILATVARSPDFAAEELEQHRSESIDGYRVYLRQPGNIAGEVAQRLVYGATPYGSGSPTEEARRAVTRDQLAQFHQTWWRPDNATLLIGGSMEAEEAFALAEELFGDWQRPATALPPVRSLAGEAQPPRVVVVDMEGAGQAAVQISLRSLERSNPDYYALAIANAVLGGGSNGRLFQEVRARRGLSYGAYSGLTQAREAGRISLTAQTRNDAAAQTAGVMLDELQRLVTEGPDQGAVDRRTNFLLGGFGRQIETTQGLTGYLATVSALGLPLDEVSNYPRAVDAVTAEDVARVTAAHIDPNQAVIVIVGDADDFIDAVRERWPNAEMIAYEDLEFGDADLGLNP